MKQQSLLGKHWPNTFTYFFLLVNLKQPLEVVGAVFWFPLCKLPSWGSEGLVTSIPQVCNPPRATGGSEMWLSHPQSLIGAASWAPSYYCNVNRCPWHPRVKKSDLMQVLWEGRQNHFAYVFTVIEGAVEATLLRIFFPRFQLQLICEVFIICFINSA